MDNEVLSDLKTHCRAKLNLDSRSSELDGTETSVGFSCDTCPVKGIAYKTKPEFMGTKVTAIDNAKKIIRGECYSWKIRQQLNLEEGEMPETYLPEDLIRP